MCLILNNEQSQKSIVIPRIIAALNLKLELGTGERILSHTAVRIVCTAVYLLLVAINLISSDITRPFLYLVILVLF